MNTRRVWFLIVAFAVLVLLVSILGQVYARHLPARVFLVF